MRNFQGKIKVGYTHAESRRIVPHYSDDIDLLSFSRSFTYNLFISPRLIAPRACNSRHWKMRDLLSRCTLVHSIPIHITQRYNSLSQRERNTLGLTSTPLCVHVSYTRSRRFFFFNILSWNVLFIIIHSHARAQAPFSALANTTSIFQYFLARDIYPASLFSTHIYIHAHTPFPPCMRAPEERERERKRRERE